jgi:hypothetical protein
LAFVSFPAYGLIQDQQFNMLIWKLLKSKLLTISELFRTQIDLKIAEISVEITPIKTNLTTIIHEINSFKTFSEKAQFKTHNLLVCFLLATWFEKCNKH